MATGIWGLVGENQGVQCLVPGPLVCKLPGCHEVSSLLVSICLAPPRAHSNAASHSWTESFMPVSQKKFFLLYSLSSVTYHSNTKLTRLPRGNGSIRTWEDSKGKVLDPAKVPLPQRSLQKAWCFRRVLRMGSAQKETHKLLPKCADCLHPGESA